MESLVDSYKGGRFNRPNDVICHSNGCLHFTDPDKRRTYHEREIPGSEGDNNLWDGACVYRLAPHGGLSVLAHCEHPDGLAPSPDERTMYVANTRSSQ
jgi:gluconolactonase